MDPRQERSGMTPRQERSGMTSRQERSGMTPPTSVIPACSWRESISNNAPALQPKTLRSRVRRTRCVDGERTWERRHPAGSSRHSQAWREPCVVAHAEREARRCGLAAIKVSLASNAMRSRQAHLGAPASCRLFSSFAGRGMSLALLRMQSARLARSGSPLSRSRLRRTRCVDGGRTWERRHPAGSFRHSQRVA
jgi:hypothetical protein